jgi:hypothetical protein
MSELHLLKVLVINDAEDTDDLRTPYLEIVRFPHPDAEMNRLASWTQHMRFWSDGEVLPEFDLALIDINFDKDGGAPVYGVDGDESHTPFGLLHALPLIARRTASRMPVVWRIHSGDAKAFRDDPVAVWAFGMLQAMQRDDEWLKYAKEHPHDQIGSHFSAVMDELQVEKPFEAWRSVLPYYRTQLAMFCDEGKVELDTNGLGVCIELAKSKDQANFVKLGEQHLTISGDKKYLRSVRSLFADVDDWTSSKSQAEVCRYLEELYSFATSWRKLYKEILETMDRITIGDESTDTPAITVNDAVRPDHRHRDLIKWGVIVFNYLQTIATGIKPSVNHIIQQLGYEKAGQSTVIAKRILANNGQTMTLQEYLDVLHNESIPNVPLRTAARQFWDHGIEERLNIKPARSVAIPACIRPPASTVRA